MRAKRALLLRLAYSARAPSLLSHSLRSPPSLLVQPVNGIVGTTDYLLDELKDELTVRVESELRGIKKCTDHMQVSEGEEGATENALQETRC